MRLANFIQQGKLHRSNVKVKVMPGTRSRETATVHGLLDDTFLLSCREQANEDRLTPYKLKPGESVITDKVGTQTLLCHRQSLIRIHFIKFKA